MAYDADAHTLVLPFSRRNSEDSIASSLSDAETELMLEMEAPPWAGDAMAPASSRQLYNLRCLLLGLDSALGADNESDEGVEDNRSAQSDCSSDGNVSDVLTAEFGLHEGHDVSLRNQGAAIWI